MRLKSFEAPTMKQAMQQVRDTLGPDAIIVTSREADSGSGVRITAALDTIPEPAAPDIPDFNNIEIEEASDTSGDNIMATLGRREGRQGGQAELGEVSPGQPAGSNIPRAEGGDWLAAEDIVDSITDALMAHNVPPVVIENIVAHAETLRCDTPRHALKACLESHFRFKSLPHNKYDRPIMMVGQPGAGKTAAIARMTARAVMEGKNPAVLSIDTIRAGGIEQLRAFTDLLEVELIELRSVDALMAEIDRLHRHTHILIDSGGYNPFNPRDMEDLDNLISVGDIEPVLVLPAGSDADEAREITSAFARLGVRWLHITRLDMARRLGGVLAAGDVTGICLADAANSSKIADGFIPMTAHVLSQLLMPADGADLPHMRPLHETSDER